MKVLTALTPMFFSTLAFAGTISGGGGRLVKYSQNPWFLENTEVVRYCITTHSDFPNISAARLDEIVQEGFLKWKDAFDYAKDDYYSKGELEPYGQIRIATQRFTADCSNPQLRFEFGGLGAEDERSFESYKDYVGAAVQTEYDIKTLTGTGFIYIAALQGKFSPDATHIDQRAWTVKQNAFLRYVVWHELGHVFGVPHGQIGSSSFTGIMDERLPELLINDQYVNAVVNDQVKMQKLENQYSPISLFKPTLTPNQIHCGEDTIFEQSRLFEVMITTKCTKVFVERIESGNGIKERVEFYQSDIGPNGPWYLFGELEKDHTSGRRNQDMQTRVFLPKEQKVFSKLPGTNEGIGLSPLFGEIKTLSESYQGVYVPMTGGERLGMKLTAVVGSDLKFIVTDRNMEISEFTLWGY